VSKRKPIKKVPTFSSGERDLDLRAWKLYSHAWQKKIPGLENVGKCDHVWKITSGPLLKDSGRNAESATLNFSLPSKLGGGRLWAWQAPQWEYVAKGIVRMRIIRSNQSLSNQRNFISAVGYVKHAADSLGLVKVSSLTPEALELACRNISHDYAETTAYNLHKAVQEFAAWCDADQLCHCRFEFKYSGLKRPELTNSIGHVRLDDAKATEVTRGNALEVEVYKLIGELYRRVPREHKYRTYILILTLLCCLGRRYSEIATLPNIPIRTDDNGNAYLIYFPRKQSAGDSEGAYRRLYLPTAVVDIVCAVYLELADSCAAARSTAEESFKTHDVDIRFLADVGDDQPLFAADLVRYGITPTLLAATSEFARDGRVHGGPSRRTAWTTKTELLPYFRKSFFLAGNIESIHIDQFLHDYYLKDLLIVRYRGLSTGAYSRWSATLCTHSMMTTFMRKFPELAAEFSSISANFDFSSHQFRHTLNTLLDEGGLSDLMQTEWFGRSNPRDTKAYQNTTREKRALMLRQEISENKVGGKIVDVLKYVPVSVRDAFLAARVSAVHDVGPGMCIHNFAQIPCERHLQCTADCDDYVWKKSDEGRIEEVKRQYALAYATRKKAEELSQGERPRRSADWVAHNDKKLKTLAQQLLDCGIVDFNPEDYLKKNGFNEQA